LKAIEALGASGSALCDWRRYLGDDLDHCAPLLRATGRHARCMFDPRRPVRRLPVLSHDDRNFVASDDDNPAHPPIEVSASDVAEFTPDWNAIGRALAPLVDFDYGAWENEGQVRKIGSKPDDSGNVRPVLLFLPAGHFWDYTELLVELGARTDGMVLFPSSGWFSANLDTLHDRNRLTFVDLYDSFVRIEADPSYRITLPATKRRHPGCGTAVRTLIRGANGLKWNQVRIEVGHKKTILLKAPGQEGVFRFPPNIRLTPDHALGMLMRLAADGEWRNPRKYSVPLWVRAQGARMARKFFWRG